MLKGIWASQVLPSGTLFQTPSLAIFLLLAIARVRNWVQLSPIYHSEQPP